jgi:hypothetical protein
MVLEEKSEMSKKIPTRKEDAASIVGEDLANQIDAVSKSTVTASDALVEMSEEPTEEETKELVAEAEKAEEPTVLASTTDPRGYTETKSKAKDKPKDEEEMDDEEGEEKVEKKSEVPAVEEKTDNSYLPYGGATSMKEAAMMKEAMEESQQVMGIFSMFQNVAWNIIDRSDVVNKKEAMKKCVDEFKSMLAAKAMVEYSRAAPVVEKSENVHPLKPALDAVLASVDNSLSMEGDANTKLQFVQPAINELGQAIMDYVQTKSVVSEEPAAPGENKDSLLKDIKELIQPAIDGISTLSERVGVLEAKSRVDDVQMKPNRIPQPRTQRIAPNLNTKSEEKPKSSIRAVVNKSVGLPENS